MQVSQIVHRVPRKRQPRKMKVVTRRPEFNCRNLSFDLRLAKPTLLPESLSFSYSPIASFKMNISSQYDRQPFPPFPSIEEQFHLPPTSKDLDHLQYHISLQDFGKQLQDAANAAYPNDQQSRYSNVYVLLLCWEDEDPKLPVSIEVEELHSLFEISYDFDVEIWKIPSHSSHNELNRKVLDFVSLGGDSKTDLKIVYYGGHGKLVYNRQASWMR